MDSTLSFTNWTGNATTSAVDVFLYDRVFANALYVLISLCCLALITALTTGYMILHVCCCSEENDEEQCRGGVDTPERSVAESSSNENARLSEFQPAQQGLPGSSRQYGCFSVTTKIGVIVHAEGDDQTTRPRRGSTSDI